MKNIKFLFLAVATLCAGAFTACQEDWNPGPVDSDLSVYMPTDQDVVAFGAKDNPETEIDETRVALYPIYRQNPGPEMVVDIRSRMYDADKGFALTDENDKVVDRVMLPEAFVFAESVTFAEGETVAYLQVTLDERLVGRVAVGTLFGAEIMIKDSKHHGAYGLYRKNVEVGIPETWVTAHVKYDPKSDEKFSNEGVMFDDFIGFLYGADGGASATVIIEQSEARPGVYRLVNPYNEESVVSFIGGVPADMSFSADDAYILIDARDPENVWIPFQFTGMTIEGFGQVYIGMTTLDDGTIGVLEDGEIRFPAKCFGIFDETGGGYYANNSGKHRIVLPGVDLADYSLGATYVGAEAAPDNSGTNAIVSFSVGADVSKFRFIAVEGKQEATYVKAEMFGAQETKFNDAILKLIDIDFNTYEPADDETLAEAKPNEATWYMSFDKPGVYTVFAFAYDKNGEPILYDMSGQPVADNIASTYFYYRPTNSTEAIPDIEEMTLKLGAPSVIGGESYPNSKPAVPMDNIYNPSYVLMCNLNYKDINYVSTLTRYFGKKEDIQKKLADGETYETLIASEDAIDTTSWIADIKEDNGIMILQGLEPGTEYAMIYAMTSIYGKTYYYYAEAKTAPYTGPATLGLYEFTDGDSKMQIEVEPYFSSTYSMRYYLDKITDDCDGQVYLLTFVGDTLKPEEDAEDQTPIELKFYGMYMPEFKAIVCYGQAIGYESYRLFGVGLDTYIDGTEEKGDPEKLWGYYSSSTSDYEYATESMVLYLNDEGKVAELATYFKKYYYWFENVPTGEKDKNGKDITEEKYFEEELTSFTPETTITLVEDRTPVVTPDDDTTTDDPTTDNPTTDDSTTDDTQKTAKRASVGVYNGTVKCELRANTNGAKTAVVSIQ